jgi:hypothetical protein
MSSKSRRRIELARHRRVYWISCPVSDPNWFENKFQAVFERDFDARRWALRPWVAALRHTAACG